MYFKTLMFLILWLRKNNFYLSNLKLVDSKKWITDNDYLINIIKNNII